MTCDICSAQVNNLKKHKRSKSCRSRSILEGMKRNGWILLRNPNANYLTIKYLEQHKLLRHCKLFYESARRDFYWTTQHYQFINFLDRLFVPDTTIVQFVARFRTDAEFRERVLLAVPKLQALMPRRKKMPGGNPTLPIFPAYRSVALLFEHAFLEDVGLKGHRVIWRKDGSFEIPCCAGKGNFSVTDELETQYRLGLIKLEPCQERVVLLSRRYAQ